MGVVLLLVVLLVEVGAVDVVWVEQLRQVLLQMAAFLRHQQQAAAAVVAPPRLSTTPGAGQVVQGTGEGLGQVQMQVRGVPLLLVFLAVADPEDTLSGGAEALPGGVVGHPTN
jgi:hypothetical protein